VPAPRIDRIDAPDRATGLVLMLHGGQPNSSAPVDDRSTSWQRARWMQRQIATRARAQGLSLWLLRFEQRGWNAGAGPEPSPVPVARRALDSVREEHGEVPVVLLGHSMGARTAVAVADDPSVAGVVALAPWLPGDEPVDRLRGKHLAAAHGRTDRITSFRSTQAFVRRAEAVAASADLTDMGPVGHYMLRRVRAWNDFAVDRSVAMVQQHAGR
jgi:pimeloyl-ACP methyl ester carboxylesterase